MKKFVIAVFGLLLFFALIQYHAPPVLTELNDITIESSPVDFDAIEMPVELRAAEVVIKGPSFEMTVINSQLSTMNNSQLSAILDLEKEVYFAGIITLYSISNRGIESGIGIDKPSKNLKSGLAQGLCPRVLSLFEFSFTA